MIRRGSQVASYGVLLLIALAGSGTAEENPFALLHQPTVSATHVAFVYADDLWIVSRTGGIATRLTRGRGPVDDPAFSPDGSSIAFTANFDGNRDVYTIGIAGGEPRRLTFHPLTDRVVGWTPDGKQILFRSNRQRLEFDRLYTIPATGGFAQELPLPMAEEGSYSPDGEWLAYVPLRRAFETWKHYRGGRTTPIWIADLATSGIEKIPREDSNDFQPMWYHDSVYFLSDREGPVTLFVFDTRTRRVRKALDNRGFDIQSASLGPDAIAYEQFGAVHLLDLKAGRSERLHIDLPALDYAQIQPRRGKVVDSVRNAAISPTGDALLEAHGEIFLASAAGGVRNLTNTSGVAERDPAWSPDGKLVAYFSDLSGEYALHIIAPQDGGLKKKIVVAKRPSFYYSPTWSPDGRKIAFRDKHLTLWWVDVDGGGPVRIDADNYGGGFRIHKLRNPVWSADSRWIAYTKEQKNHLRAMFVYSLAEDKAYQVTDAMTDVRYPAFDQGGRYLYFTSTMDGRSSSGLRQVYVALLNSNELSPLGPKAIPVEGSKTNHSYQIDADGLQNRILPMPIPARTYVGLEAGPSGTLFLLDQPALRPGEPDGQALYRFDWTDKKAIKILDGIANVNFSSDGRKLLYQKGSQWTTASVGQTPQLSEEVGLKLEGLEASIDPRAEWKQLYHEALRIERDFFFDPKLRGFDLGAAERRFQPYVDNLVSRADLNYILREILSNLGTSHVAVDGGDKRGERVEKVGLLGADYVIENDRYRFARIYTGDRWNPGKRVPLVEPGAGVRVGEYLLAINGQELRGSDNLYQRFEGLAGKPVVLRIGSEPGGQGAREVTVRPVYNDYQLRYSAWVEDNRKKVDQLSGGRLGYVHIPNTDAAGQQSVNRYYFAQADKEGLIIDIRFNSGGGSLELSDYLNRKFQYYTSMRDGNDWPNPGGAVFGPKVMIVNEATASGGDALAYYFRSSGVGPLIGKRTWGGMIGTHLVPELVDGGQVTAPDLASWLPNGTWLLENAGISPDREVEFDPYLWRAGHDPQLETAVKVALQLLAQNPHPVPKRPPELIHRN